MCKVTSRISKIEALVLESIEHEQELLGKVKQYNKLLTNIDHELEIKKLSAPNLAKVMRYRQQVLMERREVKHEYIRVQTFNQAANIQKILRMTRCSRGNVTKLITNQDDPNFIQDLGVIDGILSLDKVSEAVIFS